MGAVRAHYGDSGGWAHDGESAARYLAAADHLARDRYGDLLWLRTLSQSRTGGISRSQDAINHAFRRDAACRVSQRSQGLYADSSGNASNGAVRRDLGIHDVLLARPMGQTHRGSRRSDSSLDVSRPEASSSDHETGQPRGWDCHMYSRLLVYLRRRCRDLSDTYWISGYSSCAFRAIAVTRRRGPKRTDSASSQFLNPEITTGFPAINAR